MKAIPLEGRPGTHKATVGQGEHRPARINVWACTGCSFTPAQAREFAKFLIDAAAAAHHRRSIAEGVAVEGDRQ
jgi:hypothetical protein